MGSRALGGRVGGSGARLAASAGRRSQPTPPHTHFPAASIPLPPSLLPLLSSLPFLPLQSQFCVEWDSVSWLNPTVARNVTQLAAGRTVCLRNGATPADMVVLQAESRE